MAKHKTAELEGALLDAAVAKAEGWRFDGVVWRSQDGLVTQRFPPPYSTNWFSGGPIVHSHAISIVASKGFDFEEDDLVWSACVGSYTHYIDEQLPLDGEAPDPLTAAMRAYVANKFGDEVELP